MSSSYISSLVPLPLQKESILLITLQQQLNLQKCVAGHSLNLTV